MFVADRLLQVLLPDRLQFLCTTDAVPEPPCEERADQQSHRDGGGKRGPTWNQCPGSRGARFGQHGNARWRFGFKIGSFTVREHAAGVHLAWGLPAGKAPFFRSLLCQVVGSCSFCLLLTIDAATCSIRGPVDMIQHDAALLIGSFVHNTRACCSSSFAGQVCCLQQ